MLWAADGQAEEEAKGRVETTSRSLNIFFSSISNVSSKKNPKKLEKSCPRKRTKRSSISSLYLSIHSLTHSLILAYPVPCPVREAGDKEVPKKQPLCLRSLQAVAERACQETRLAQSVPGHDADLGC